MKTSCNIFSSGSSDVDGSNAWHMWCDGGTRTAPLIGHRKRRVTVGAGWGFCLFPQGCQTPTSRDDAILTRRGPVVLNAESKLFVGATRLTNNVAEMSALIEVCWFLLAIHAPHPRCVNRRRQMAMRTQDSKYAIGIAQGLFFPRENVLMAKLLRHLYGVVQRVPKDTMVIWGTCWQTHLQMKAAQWNSQMTGISCRWSGMQRSSQMCWQSATWIERFQSMSSWVHK